MVWRFNTIPQPGEFGYDTWPKDAYKYIGAVNTWGELSVDTARGIAFFPTGSPTYDYYGADRPGANLYGTSLLALDARTGKRHLALPARAPRPLGLRHQLRAAADDHPAKTASAATSWRWPASPASSTCSTG